MFFIKTEYTIFFRNLCPEKYLKGGRVKTMCPTTEFKFFAEIYACILRNVCQINYLRGGRGKSAASARCFFR